MMKAIRLGIAVAVALAAVPAWANSTSPSSDNKAEQTQKPIKSEASAKKPARQEAPNTPELASAPDTWAARNR
jgi:hypothetical protein